MIAFPAEYAMRGRMNNLPADALSKAWLILLGVIFAVTLSATFTVLLLMLGGSPHRQLPENIRVPCDHVFVSLLAEHTLTYRPREAGDPAPRRFIITKFGRTLYIVDEQGACRS